MPNLRLCVALFTLGLAFIEDNKKLDSRFVVYTFFGEHV
jgi:hypothetical protein